MYPPSEKTASCGLLWLPQRGGWGSPRQIFEDCFCKNRSFRGLKYLGGAGGTGKGRNFRYQDNWRICSSYSWVCLDMVKSASWCNTKKAVALIGDNVKIYDVLRQSTFWIQFQIYIILQRHQLCFGLRCLFFEIDVFSNKFGCVTKSMQNTFHGITFIPYISWTLSAGW